MPEESATEYTLRVRNQNAQPALSKSQQIPPLQNTIAKLRRQNKKVSIIMRVVTCC